MNHRPNIFILTDFGTSDHYVAVMKAVILSRCPDANLVDVTHEVPPQNVEAGAYLLESAWPWLPDNCVVLAVVDPGVGTDREAAVFCHKGKTVIAPNNGLLDFLPADASGRVLDRPEFWLQDISATFHGRDIFAPCAAYVAAGGAWTLLGNRATSPLKLNQESASVDGNKLTARIIYFDHFGNAITSLRWEQVEAAGADAGTAEIPGRVRCPLVRTYGDTADGKPLVYFGSTGRLELAIRGGSAREHLGLQMNDSIYLELGAVNE